MSVLSHNFENKNENGEVLFNRHYKIEKYWKRCVIAIKRASKRTYIKRVSHSIIVV